MRFFHRLFALDDTPERIALAFATGVFLAFTPLIGLHTFLGCLCVFFFGLNRIALFIGVFVNNPWTLVPIYAAGTWIGGLFVGFPSKISLPSFEWSALLSRGFWLELAGQWQLWKPMFLGSTILSFIAAALAYIIALRLIRRRRARHSVAVRSAA